MHKIFKILFILFLAATDLFSMFVLFDEIRRKGWYTFEDSSLLILVSLLLLSIPAFVFQYRTLKTLESRTFSEKNILDISLENIDEADTSKATIPWWIWLGNLGFGLEIFILGIVSGMILVENLPPNINRHAFIRISVVFGLLIMGGAMIAETVTTWNQHSKQSQQQ